MASVEMCRMKKIVVALLAAVLLVPPSSASALEKEPFSPERFQALQAEGALVLVDIYATWCPVCRQQQEILAAYQAARPDVKLHVLEVDFDRHKDWVREFRAPRQSTLILFKGTEQRWYSVAESRRDAIFAALDEAAGRQ
jgi:thioredoxin 1